MRRKFRNERLGSLEMPAQLLITMIIVAATASIGFGAMSAYSKSTVEGGLRLQAESISAAATRLDSMGLDSSLQLSVELENAPMEKMTYFKIGHPLTRPLHPYAGMIRFKAESSEEGHVYVKDGSGNPLPLCSKDGGALELGAGTHRIHLSRQFSDEANMVFIELEKVN